MQIETYPHECASYRPYDADFVAVAAKLAKLIEGAAPGTRVEHFGSTAVPGCGGKGVIDLMVLYSADGLESAKDALSRLGFQPQSTRDPFPESRPMRVGSVLYEDIRYALHAHVLTADAAEVAVLRQFREWLKEDPANVAAYAARKLEILAAGIRDTVAYSLAKEDFIRSVLAKVVESQPERL